MPVVAVVAGCYARASQSLDALLCDGLVNWKLETDDSCAPGSPGLNASAAAQRETNARDENPADATVPQRTPAPT